MMRSRVLAFATIAIAFGCSSDRVTDPVTPLGLDLSIAPKTDTLYLDTTAPSQPTVQLNATATSMGNPIALPAGRVFASDNASVASVDSLTGLVQATGVGTTQVSVRVNAVKAFATIVVLPIVQSVQVTASATQALAGDTISVTATVLGWQGQPLTGQPLTFSSSSPAAKVSPTGQVVFSGPGTATITATSGAAKASVALTALAREFVGGAAGSISSGMDATCGLLPLGRTFCFGLAPITGVAKDTSCFGGSPSDPLKCTLVPLQIANNLQLTTLAMGDSVACGLDSQNRAYCWGDQTYGQVGNGIAKQGTSSLPVPVRGPLGQAETFTKIAAGHAHACGLDPSGHAYCWGMDSTYQLGGSDRLVVNSSTPIPVDPTMTFTAIAAGRGHTCAVRSGDGAAVCWGANDKGQLGQGTVGVPSDVPTAVIGGVSFTKLSALRDFTCGLATTGSIYCWGANEFGQTGQAPSDSIPTPTAVAGSGYTSVAAGWYHACALTSTGAAVCWGSNAYAQVGNNVLTGGVQPTPSPVVNSPVFTALSAGSRTTCGLTSSGAFCWGSTLYGAAGSQLQALKLGTPTKTATPQ